MTTIDMLLETEIGRLSTTRFTESPSLLFPLLGLWPVIPTTAFLSLLCSQFDGEDGCKGYKDGNNEAAHAWQDSDLER